jgi:enoyl-CoA hydratase
MLKPEMSENGMAVISSGARDARFSTIRMERHGAAIWIVLDRSGALNSISPSMVGEIDEVLDIVERDRSASALVITGEGRAFSAGGDLKAVAEVSQGEDINAANEAFLSSITGLLSRLEKLPLPVIAAVNGLALAGGLEIVLCCDIVIAAEHAVFGDGHANFGLLPGGGGSVRLPRKLGANRAKYMMFTAVQLTAQTMLDWGLVTKVVPAATLHATVDRLTESLSEKSPLALRRMKQMIDDSLDQPLDVALRAEQVTCSAHSQSFDRNEGLAAFNEKRKPRFQGQ